MQKPDIIVGIDIGQTCSGVAYSIGPDWSDPRNLNKWPSNDGFERADKVASRVGYHKTRHNLVNWGFESDYRDDNVIVHEQFKLVLDAEYEDDRGISCSQARRWYHDYLRQLYREIEIFFDSSIPGWRNLRVEYHFSTPTTWNNPAMIASIEHLIKSAGFASTRMQTVHMALTEAEAAAIEASTTRYSTGDVFLICDAGGGTTDVNLLKVKSTGRKIELEPLDHVEGVAIGSTLIDFQMTQHIVERLDPIREHLKDDIYVLAEEMIKDRFQIVKHSFPNPVVDEFWLDVKGLPGTQSFPEAGIVDSRMSISRGTLKHIFDQQVGKIFDLIDDRILGLQEYSPNEKVSYIILSGGLGSSPYLFEEMKRRYEMSEGFRSTNTPSTRIMKVLEPQLAVVRGLVKERIQNLGTYTMPGGDVFTTRRCRNSYGVLVRLPYHEEQHFGMQFVEDLDGRRWIENNVDWFIKKGESIDAKAGVRRHYGATIAEGRQYEVRQVLIVMSTLPVDRLPRQSTDAGCKTVAAVNYQLTDNDMKLKNRQVWKLKKKFWKADFTFVVKLGPADLRFQILGRDDVLSTDHQGLKVEFMDPSEHKQTSASKSNGLGGRIDSATPLAEVRHLELPNINGSGKLTKSPT